MKPTFKQVEGILKQLPISYYLKRKAHVSLSKEESNSFINLVTGDIVISFQQIEKFDSFSDEELEINIRNNLYHEISHAILSPLPHKMIIDKDIYNCFEDERIETLLQDYYLDVNFKKNLYKAHPTFELKTPFDYFFYCIRLRGGGVELNSDIDNLIIKWKNLMFDIKPQNTLEYQKDIDELYKKIVKDFATSNSSFSQIEDVKESSPTVASKEARIGETQMQEIAETITSKLTTFDDKDFRRQAELIINSRNSDKSNNSESKNTYSGKLIPKLIGRPNDDYKWFTKKGDGLYQFDRKLKLNLFIDQSGSYRNLEDATNSVLKELSVLERKIKDFSFDLVVINKDIELKKKNHKFIECKEGNCLTSMLGILYNKIQDSKSKTINIALFNGDMATDSYVEKGITIQPFTEYQYQNLKTFNNRNTIIISDLASRRPLMNYCKKAKIIYTKNYLEELKKYILKSLKILIK